jgi:hydroxyacylglutathione hydrolase
MLIFAHPTRNRLANIDYLLACPDSGECVAIDPWDASSLMSAAKERDWDIRHIVNTHTHWDHTRGNEALQESTGASVYCHPAARHQLTHASKGLEHGAQLTVGRATLRVLDTPGHTLSHICLVGESENSFLVSGDTLFNAGAGNCHNGGDPSELFQTFETIFSELPNEMELLPGHDYLENNLKFSLVREPGNAWTQKALQNIKPNEPYRMTLGQERGFNPFFRLDEQALVLALREAFPERPLDTRKQRFLALRELRNAW